MAEVSKKMKHLVTIAKDLNKQWDLSPPIDLEVEKTSELKRGIREKAEKYLYDTDDQILKEVSWKYLTETLGVKPKLAEAKEEEPKEEEEPEDDDDDDNGTEEASDDDDDDNDNDDDDDDDDDDNDDSSDDDDDDNDDSSDDDDDEPEPPKKGKKGKDMSEKDEKTTDKKEKTKKSPTPPVMEKNAWGHRKGAASADIDTAMNKGDMNIEEIAESLEMTPGRVKSHFKSLEKDGFEVTVSKKSGNIKLKKPAKE